MQTGLCPYWVQSFYIVAPCSIFLMIKIFTWLWKSQRKFSARVTLKSLPQRSSQFPSHTPTVQSFAQNTVICQVTQIQDGNPDLKHFTYI